MNDYTIDILEEEEIIRVKTTFDTSFYERSNIKGISYCSHVDRYSFDAKKGDLFTYENVVKNIEAHFENRFDKNFGVLDFSKTVSTVLDVSDLVELEISNVFKNQGRKEKEL